MFEPSEERTSFLDELNNRSETEIDDWDIDVETSVVKSVVGMIETAAEWPRSKILPTDSLAVMFHGPAESDMAFSRFTSLFFEEFGVRISIGEIQQCFNIEDARLIDFLVFIQDSIHQKDIAT